MADKRASRWQSIIIINSCMSSAGQYIRFAQYAFFFVSVYFIILLILYTFSPYPFPAGTDFLFQIISTVL